MSAEGDRDLQNFVKGLKRLAERAQSKRMLEFSASAVVAETVERALLELATCRSLFDNEKLAGFLQELDHVIFELKTFKSVIDKELAKLARELDDGQEPQEAKA